MPKIKIVRVLPSDTLDDWGEVVNHNIVLEEASDWEEVTEADLLFIQTNLHLLSWSKKYNKKGARFEILMQDSFSVPERITQIRQALENQEKERQKAQARLKAQEEKEKLERERKKLERERKKLEKLFASNPELVESVVNKST